MFAYWCIFSMFFIFPADSSSSIFVGCYEHFDADLSIGERTVQTVEECIDFCRMRPFAALKNSDKCQCGSNVKGSTVPLSRCYSSRALQNESVDVLKHNSVYLAQNITLPVYIGCYKDEGHDRRAMENETWDSKMTNEKCSERCLSLGYYMMATQFGEVCFCGNTYKHHNRVSEEECNMTCKNNQSQICGGSYRNSVYYTCFSKVLNKSCAEIFHCQAWLSLSSPGLCRTDECQPGWKGDSCNERNCFVENGLCGEHECVEFVLDKKTISECACSRGYHKKTVHDSCTDINECETQNSPCDEAVSTCHNFPGSYNCSCKKNYFRIDEFTCGYVHWQLWSIIIGTILAVLLIVVSILMIYCSARLRSKRASLNDSPVEVTDNICNGIGKRISLLEIENYYEVHREELLTNFNLCSEGNNTKLDNSVLPCKQNNKTNKPKNDIFARLDACSMPVLIHTYGKSPRHLFIALKDPDSEAMVDFVKLIFKEKVKIIVMLTGNNEACYWSTGKSIKFGEVTVKCEEEEKHVHYKISKLLISLGKKQQSVHHFQFISWPVDGRPENGVSLLNFYDKVMSTLVATPDNKIIVHCSDGVGRTGTFIALDYLLRQAKEEGYIDLYQCLNSLRKQKCAMIQSSFHYLLAYRAVILFYALGPSTCIATYRPAAGNAAPDQPIQFWKGTNTIEKEFQVIEYEIRNQEGQVVKKPEIMLSFGELDAIYAPSYQNESKYIIGKLPSNLNNSDLFKLFLHHCNCLVVFDRTKRLDISFMTQNKKKMKFNEGTLRYVDKKQTSYGMTYLFRLDLPVKEETGDIENYIKLESALTFLHVTDMGDTFFEHDKVVQMYSALEPYLVPDERKTVAVLSITGYEDAGYFVAALNLIGMMVNFSEVDVYETVFELRKLKPDIVRKSHLYKKLYSLVEYYLKTGDLRENSEKSSRKAMKYYQQLVKVFETN